VTVVGHSLRSVFLTLNAWECKGLREREYREERGSIGRREGGGDIAGGFEGVGAGIEARLVLQAVM
jgi:hypothetical protein